MKSLLVLLALTLTTSAFARDNNRGNDGRMGTNDGGSIIRIEIGNDRDTDSRAVMKRMVQLERAVRELQNRVYDLEDDSRPQTREVRVFTCVLPTAFDGTFVGKGTTEIEAKAEASKACERSGAAFCGVNRVTRCESSVEVVRN